MELTAKGEFMAKVELLLRAVSKTYFCYGTPIYFGTCNTVLIRSEDQNILVDPGHLSFRSLIPRRLAKKQLSVKDINTVINTHLHFDHFANNHLFRGAELLVHKKELDSMEQRYWPEMTKAFIDPLKVQPVSKAFDVTSEVKVIETFGHTAGSISVLVNTQEGKVIIAGDAVALKEDFTEGKAPMFSENPEEARRSIKEIRKIEPSKIFPGHDEPFLV